MKIYSLFLLIILSFCNTNVYAQNVKVEVGSKIKFSSNTSHPKYLYGDDTGYYLWAQSLNRSYFSSKITYFLYKLDLEFNLVSTTEFESSEKNVYDEGINYINGKFVWILSERDKKSDKLTYRATPISYEGKSSKSITISRFKYENKKDIPLTSVHYNIDTTNVLFLAESDNNSKKDVYQIHLVSLDRDLEKLWDKTLRFAKTESQITLLSKELNNKGEAFLLYKVYDEKKKEKQDNKPAYNIELMHIKNDTSEIKKYNLALDDSFIKSANLKVRDNGELYCVGLFSNTVDGPTHGVFFMKLDNNEVTIATKKRFSLDDIEKLGNKKTEKDNSGEEGLNDDFSFRSVKILNDGSSFVTVEVNYQRTFTYRSGNNFRYETEYYSEDIIIINILPNGEIARLNIVTKYQHRQNTDILLGHSSFIYNDKIYLFYNEDKDNYKKDIGDKPKTTSNYLDFVTTMITLDKDGNFERTPLFTYKDTESILLPKEIKQVSENKYFFTTLQQKFFSSPKYIFGSINLSPE